MGRTVLGRGIRSAARQMLRHQTVGRPTSAVLRLFGADALGGEIDKLCKYVPPRVPVRIPSIIAPDAFFLIDSDHGKDQCAAALWWKGWGGYEALVTSLFAAYAAESRCIVDVGANTGLFSLTAAACSPSAIIHAFEPFPLCQKLLDANLRLNGFETRVRICRQALSEKDGELNLYVPKQDHGLDETSCSLNSDFRAEHSEVIPVPVVTLDGYCRENKIEKIDLLKIDVETHEPQVLRGATEVLDKHRPMIFLEVLVCADVAALNALADRHKYIPIVMTDDRLEICSKVEYHPGHFNQLFCPPEKLAALEQIASRIGYEVARASRP